MLYGIERCVSVWDSIKWQEQCQRIIAWFRAVLGAVVAPQRKCAPSWWVFSTQCPGAPCSQSSVSVRSAFWCRDFLSFFLVFVRPDPVSPAADVAETISVDFVFHFSSFSDRFLSSVAVCFGLFEAYSAVGMQLRCKKNNLWTKMVISMRAPGALGACCPNCHCLFQLFLFFRSACWGHVVVLINLH